MSLGVTLVGSVFLPLVAYRWTRCLLWTGFRVVVVSFVLGNPHLFAEVSYLAIDLLYMALQFLYWTFDVGRAMLDLFVACTASPPSIVGKVTI